MTIRDNLIEAIKEVTAHRDKMDLGAWAIEEECGTIYCAAGLLATKSFFIKQGLHLVSDEDARGMWNLWYGDCPFAHLPRRVLDRLFGTDAFDKLFVRRGNGYWDDELLKDNELTDKELVLARLNKQLEMYSC